MLYVYPKHVIIFLSIATSTLAANTLIWQERIGSICVTKRIWGLTLSRAHFCPYFWPLFVNFTQIQLSVSGMEKYRVRNPKMPKTPAKTA
jgi:hypothetical protein